MAMWLNMPIDTVMEVGTCDLGYGEPVCHEAVLGVVLMLLVLLHCHDDVWILMLLLGHEN